MISITTKQIGRQIAAALARSESSGRSRPVSEGKGKSHAGETPSPIDHCNRDAICNLALVIRARKDIPRLPRIHFSRHASSRDFRARLIVLLPLFSPVYTASARRASTDDTKLALRNWHAGALDRGQRRTHRVLSFRQWILGATSESNNTVNYFVTSYSRKCERNAQTLLTSRGINGLLE